MSPGRRYYVIATARPRNLVRFVATCCSARARELAKLPGPGRTSSVDAAATKQRLAATWQHKKTRGPWAMGRPGPGTTKQGAGLSKTGGHLSYCMVKVLVGRQAAMIALQWSAGVRYQRNFGRAREVGMERDAR